MSQRGLERASKGTVSKSAVSRMWEEKSREQLATLRERRLDETQWLAVMLDGVFIGKETCVVIALGIDAQVRKQVLDFEAGSSESAETVSRLIGRLDKRGVRPPKDMALLVIRDGSQAIASDVSRHWPGAVQQACLVHVECNIADRLRRRDRSENQRLFRRLRETEGREAGEEKRNKGTAQNGTYSPKLTANYISAQKTIHNSQTTPCSFFQNPHRKRNTLRNPIGNP